MRLKDKVCIVTGGASGLGKTFSLALAEQGAKVTVCANSSDPTPVVEEIKSKGGEAIGLKVDVREVASTEEMAAKTKEAFGRIDVLIANAGLYGQLRPQPFEPGPQFLITSCDYYYSIPNQQIRPDINSNQSTWLPRQSYFLHLGQLIKAIGVVW